ncbi:MAG: Sec-independent protein translocase protein TatB [Gammaproteobacteria bacterium]
MFDVGFWELLIIALLALLVLGPERLPAIVKTAGNWAGRARFMARSLRMQIEQEMAQEVTARKKAEAEAKKSGPPPESAEGGADASEAPASPKETGGTPDSADERTTSA